MVKIEPWSIKQLKKFRRQLQFLKLLDQWRKSNLSIERLKSFGQCPKHFRSQTEFFQWQGKEFEHPIW